MPIVVIGVGVDLVEIDRVQDSFERWGERLVEKLMDRPESRALPADPRERGQALAFAIAGKEAVSKALGTGWSRGVQWRHVIVSAAPSPAARLRGRAADVARALGSRGSGELLFDRRGNILLAEYRLLS